MVKLNKIEIQILQGGNAVREYEDPATETTKDSITRYIEITEGQPFAILFARDLDYDLTYYDTFIFSPTIDGHEYDGTVFPKGSMILEKEAGRFRTCIHGCDKVVNGREVIQKFQFEETEIRHIQMDETLDELREQFKDQGTVCIEVSQCLSEIVSDDESSSDDEEEELESQRSIPKDIVKEKGLTSMASLKIVRPPDPDSDEDEDDRKEIFRPTRRTREISIVAKFLFKYRTIEALYDQNIVPRPEKEPPTLESRFEALQRDYDELKQRLKQEDADKAARSSERKRKVLQTLEPGEIELIEERPAHRRKPNADDVVIELDD